MISTYMMLERKLESILRRIQSINPNILDPGSTTHKLLLRLRQPRNRYSNQPPDLIPFPPLPSRPANPLAPRSHLWAAAHRMGSST